jgi:tRNA pseudouridine55 synthase
VTEGAPLGAARPGGVVVVDKPRGPTSFDVVARVRRAFGERRVGHAGTLDPMATGVLPVCVGEACKLVPFLMADDKEYEAEALLGVATDTLDAMGRVVRERPAGHLRQEDVEAALDAFRGQILQRPPMYSAVRVGGRRLYEEARRGVEVERAERPVRIDALTLEGFQAEGERVTVRLRVRCGKGTYIRALACDLGEALGTGAHLTALRRTRVGRFMLADAVPLERVGQGRVLDAAEALEGLPTVRLDARQARDVRDGKPAAVARLAPLALASANDGGAESPVSGPARYVRLLRPEGTLLAVAEEVAGRLSLVRVFS